MAEFADPNGGYCVCAREHCTDECKTYRAFHPKSVTNYDRIIAKSPEELAELMAWPYVAEPPWCADNVTCPHVTEDVPQCDQCALTWLMKEV